ncbi:helicase-like protein [Burkholderia phage CSP3]|nr:helicase-like protein [Burkholderia phage CSP3]
MIDYGFIYALSNHSMPGLYKLGMTTRSPRQRAAELSRASGVPFEFQVEFYVEVRNPARVEALLHERFDACRENQAREFFRVDLLDVLDWLYERAESHFYGDNVIEAMEARRLAAIEAERAIACGGRLQ